VSSISESAEPAVRNQGYVCSNASCRKVFAKPLKATNLQQENAEPYDACPFCLTEISSEEESSQQATAKTGLQDTNARPLADGSSQCKNHFGYLSQQGSKKQIPDECMVCKDVVQCMLKKTLQ
jgi:hypothetical protein